MKMPIKTLRKWVVGHLGTYGRPAIFKKALKDKAFLNKYFLLSRSQGCSTELRSVDLLTRIFK